MQLKYRVSVLVPVVSALLLFCWSLSAQAEQAEPVSAQIIKSPADEREYRAITLDNGLKVMLVSDASTDRAAAALDVHVGSGHDPQDRQGLAHYLEHMLFLGTKKYPESGEYQAYIAEHGGSNNAYTVLDHTNYFFNITPEFFAGGLDRFAQFFIAPLFTEAYVTRERAVVDSEYQARKDDEGRRLWTARRELYNPGHPSTQFSVGNLETLADREGDPVREDLIAFYQRYYHASRMALSVVSNHSLDQLQAWVEAKFSAIPAAGEAYTPFSEALILPSERPLQLRLKPIKETRQVTFSFPIESVQVLEDSKPGNYLSNLIGHEGEGSLLALLKSRSWANSLSAGTGYSDEIQANFDINMSLSEKGFTHIDEIGRLLFSYIQLIREQGVKEVYYNELARLAELDFRFQEKSSESSLVRRLAASLHRYEAKDILSVPYLYQAFKPERIRRILGQLQPDNLQLIIVDPQLESAMKTDWYNVAYEVAEIDPDWLQAWREAQPVAQLTLPAPNPFVPDQLDMLAQQDAGPSLPLKLEGAGNVQVWHQTELRFEQPKAALYFSLRSPSANSTPREAMLTELYVNAVQEALNAYYYPAYLAGLNFQIYRHSRGLSVRIDGYAAKQAQLLERIVAEMRGLQVDQPRFDLYFENARKALENSLKGRPSQIVINGVYDVLLTSGWSTQEKLDAMQTIDLDALQSHAGALLVAPELLLLSVGNVSADDSLRAGQLIAGLDMSEQEVSAVARAKVRKLRPGPWTLQESPALPDDAAIALIYQGKTATIEELAATQLLGSLIHAPYYQALRTEGQLGYIVQAFAFNMLDTPALGFSVQSNSHSVSDIVGRTQQFLETYKNTLSSLPEASFLATRAGLIAQLTEEDKQLSSVAARYWSELDREAYDFATRERLVAALEEVDKAALMRYLERMLAMEDVGVLLSYSYGNKSSELDFPAAQKAIRYDSLQALRENVNDYF